MKHSSLLASLILLFSSSASHTAQEDLDEFLAMDKAARDAHVASMRATTNNALNDELRGYICDSATDKSYAVFTETVDYVKTEIGDPTFGNMTYGEVAFYVNCDENYNPFARNIHPGKIHMPAEGLADSTNGMIKNAGPLLLEQGPDGRTALEYVEVLLQDAAENSTTEVQGVYGMIKSRIEIEIIQLNQVDLSDEMSEHVERSKSPEN